MADEHELADDEETRIRPLPNPNLADLQTIPVGSEVMVVNYEGEPPSIGCLIWNEQALRDGENSFSGNDPDERFLGTFMAFLPPETHSKNVQNVDDIVAQAIETLPTIENLAGMTVLFRTIIQQARQGLVENPF